MRADPVAIEVRGVHKAFRVPDQRIDSLKERVARPLQRVHHRELHALRDVSFDVRRGEFFGIVGRNGSGKSTLLKILASIYGADAGRVRMAGRMAPFIELGVGFNPELPARENVLLNGVLLGLTRREAERRHDAVLDFAELHDFAEVKLKNYSSGMMVRLAFAVMVQADADIMLVDEVLAVGDAAFGQKCMDVFHERKREGRTVVLVTHDMATVQALCHRAMLLHDGQVQFVGEPEEAAMRYFRMNFAKPVDGRLVVPDFNVEVVHARAQSVAEGTPIAVDVRLRARRELVGAHLHLQVRNDHDVVVATITRTVEGRVAAGQELAVEGTIENRLVPGRHHLDCWIRREGEGGDLAVQALRLLDFDVYGISPRDGLVHVDSDLEVRPL